MSEGPGTRERTPEELFVRAYRGYIHRAGAAELLEWLRNETDFFSAPASTKHHLAHPGGWWNIVSTCLRNCGAQ